MSGGAPAIALLGGECSGKSGLAQGLGERLQAHGHRACVVPEYLRQWVDEHQRTPTASEQAAIAQQQTQAIEAARHTDGTHLVLADTTAVMTAAYSELYFGDTSLWPLALAWQRSCAQTWLMGCDLPWRADGTQRDGPEWRQRTDALLRQRLQEAGMVFQVFHGTLPLRINQAWRALSPWVGEQNTDSHLTQGRVAWRCEDCSDPDCEHRLFSRLLPKR